jgi:hypothetical protein
LNLPRADWEGDAERANGFQAVVNNLVRDSSYTQVVSGPTGEDALLDVYLLRPESSLISCNIFLGISDHNEFVFEVGWDEISRKTKVERIVPVYRETDVLGLQAFLREMFNMSAGNDNCVEMIWRSYKNIVFDGIKRYVLKKLSEENPFSQYYNNEVKRLKVKVRKMYNKKNLGGLANRI